MASCTASIIKRLLRTVILTAVLKYPEVKCPETYPVQPSVQPSFVCNLCNYQLRPYDLDLTSKVFSRKPFHLDTHRLDFKPTGGGV